MGVFLKGKRRPHGGDIEVEYAPGGVSVFQPPVDGSVVMVKVSDGSVAMIFDETVGFDMGGFQLNNVQIPTPPLWRVLQVDNDANNHKIVNVLNPSDPQDAATKNYVDTSRTGVEMAIVTISVAELLAIHSTPKQILAAPGAGKIIMPYAGWYNRVNDPLVVDVSYAGIWKPEIGIDNGATFVKFLYTQFDSAPLDEGKFGAFVPLSNHDYDYHLQNKPLLFGNEGNALTGGNADLKVHVLYTVLTL